MRIFGRPLQTAISYLCALCQPLPLSFVNDDDDYDDDYSNRKLVIWLLCYFLHSYSVFQWRPVNVMCSKSLSRSFPGTTNYRIEPIICNILEMVRYSVGNLRIKPGGVSCDRCDTGLKLVLCYLLVLDGVVVPCSDLWVPRYC